MVPGTAWRSLHAHAAVTPVSSPQVSHRHSTSHTSCCCDVQAMDHVKGVQVDLETKLATVEVEAPNLIDAMNMLPLFVKAIKVGGREKEREGWRDGGTATYVGQ